MNHAQEILQSMAERFASTASVKQVFGEPIERGGRTIVPVARVKYRLGAGYGGGEQEGAAVDRPLAAGGGGGGGVVKAKAVGALEITQARCTLHSLCRCRRHCEGMRGWVGRDSDHSAADRGRR